MKDITLNNGVKIPAVGLGTWPYLGDELMDVMEKAWDVGYRRFDTAWMYNNETVIGEFIKKKNIKRDEIFITSKLHINNLYLHRYHYRYPNIRVRSVKRAYKDSCRRLGVEVIDLFLLHWPFPGYLKMWEELTKLYLEGKVRAIGVSSFMPKHLEVLKEVSDVVPAVNQIEMHPYNSRNDVVEYCLNNGIIPEAYSPLGTGLRTQDLINNPVLSKIGSKNNVGVAQVILRWLYQQGVLSVPRTNKIEKLRQNISIFDFDLSPEDMNEINNLNKDDYIRDYSRT